MQETKKLVDRILQFAVLEPRWSFKNGLLKVCEGSSSICRFKLLHIPDCDYGFPHFYVRLLFGIDGR